MAGYTRQSIAEIDAGEDVNAEPLADEFNALADAFNGVTGHSHDGSSGNAPKINLTTSVSGELPTANIANDAVTFDKIQNINSMRVIGNVSGSGGSPAEVTILDEDDMSTNSATAIPTQQSVKAYVDTLTNLLARLPIITYYTSSDTHTFDADTTIAEIEVWGAGGGGRSTDANTPRSGPGGGAGGYSRKLITAIPATATIIVGAGGSAGSAGGNSSYADGTETITAAGGGSGSTATGSGAAAGGVGGTATGGDINIRGQDGERTFGSVLNRSGAGGAPPMGVGWAPFGRMDATTSIAELDAVGFCAGGTGANSGGSSIARTAGSGAPGLIIIKEW